jgi:hypothetical protein
MTARAIGGNSVRHVRRIFRCRKVRLVAVDTLRRSARKPVALMTTRTERRPVSACERKNGQRVIKTPAPLYGAHRVARCTICSDP